MVVGVGSKARAIDSVSPFVPIRRFCSGSTNTGIRVTVQTKQNYVFPHEELVSNFKDAKDAVFE